MPSKSASCRKHTHKNLLLLCRLDSAGVRLLWVDNSCSSGLLGNSYPYARVCLLSVQHAELTGKFWLPVPPICLWTGAPGHSAVTYPTWYFQAIRGALAFRTAEPLFKRNTKKLFLTNICKDPIIFIWNSHDNREGLLSRTTHKSREKRTTSRVNLVQAKKHASVVGNR